LKKIFDQFKKYLFYFRKGGLKEFYRFYKLNKFEKNIFSQKKLVWNNLGYWQVDPMPSEEELQKFYSEIYWLNNKYYKSNLVIPRDLDHFNFYNNNIQSKFEKKINFMNFGAGHGGISYLMASNMHNVVNIEPSEILSYNYDNFLSFENIEKIINEKDYFEKFEVIYSSHTLEHLTDPLTFFKKISKVLKSNGLVFIEVPNCRKSKITKDYAEGGCDGKITGSHLIYFTKDFFKHLNSEIFLFKEGHDGNSYTEVKSEDDADCIRAIIKAENIKNWINASKIY
jgi:2-polyprenyl-3-methyl-5-hydroxy-6-metoxy-1,4-benzoquinol methylase